jgi:hypothetical protein
MERHITADHVAARYAGSQTTAPGHRPARPARGRAAQRAILLCGSRVEPDRRLPAAKSAGRPGPGRIFGSARELGHHDGRAGGIWAGTGSRLHPAGGAGGATCRVRVFRRRPRGPGLGSVSPECEPCAPCATDVGPGPPSWQAPKGRPPASGGSWSESLGFQAVLEGLLRRRL